MKPLLQTVVAVCLLLAAHAHPENIEEVKELAQTKDTVLDAEESGPQARVERCTTCSGSVKLKLSPNDILGALRALPPGQVHTEQSFEGCSLEKGCAGIKVKDGKVIERFGNADSFNAAAAANVGNEFSFHAAGEDVPFWWMNENSPFKNGGGNFQQYKSSSSSFSSVGSGAGSDAGATGNGFGVSFDLSSNPFLNGGSKAASSFASTAQESSSTFSSSNNDAELANNPFLNGGFQAQGGFGQNAFTSSDSKFGGSGYIGSSPRPFSASASTPSNVNFIQNSQKTSEYDYEQTQTFEEDFESCTGQGYVCVLKGQCSNGVVAVKGAGTKKQSCNTRTEVCCRLDAGFQTSFTGSDSQGSSGFGSSATGFGSSFSSKGNSATGFGTTGSFGSSTVAPVNRFDSSTGYKSTSQTNFIETDSFQAGSDNLGVFRPGAIGSGLKPGLPYLPPDNTNSPSNVVTSTFPPPTTASTPRPTFSTPRPTFSTPRPTFSTPRPTFTTPRPTLRPTTSAPEYLPPHIGQPSNTEETRLPRPGNYDEGQIILDENRFPKPKPTPGVSISTIPVGCAAALKCTPIEFCTAEGVMSNTSVFLNSEQQAYRVPLTDCKNPDTGAIGKCCRDPNYTDPWPTNQLGKWVQNVFGGNDGKYVPDNRGSPDLIKFQNTPKPDTGSINLNAFRNPKPTTTPFGPNQVTPGYSSSTVNQGTFGQGQFSQGSQGTYTQKGQGTFTQKGQGQFGQGQIGQFGQGSKGQFGIAGQGQTTSNAGQFGKETQFTQSTQTTQSFGQGQIVNQGKGQFGLQGQGQFGTQGQGQINKQGQFGQGQLDVQGQGSQSQLTQVQKGIQGQGQIVKQSEGQIISQGQGFGVKQGQGQNVITGQGTGVRQGQGFGFTQGQGVVGVGQVVSQGQGVGVTQGQGVGVNQGQGFGTSKGQGQIVSQGQGFGITQTKGQGVISGQGQTVSQGVGVTQSGYSVTRGQGQGVSQGQGQIVSQGQGVGISQGQGLGVSQGQGVGISQGQGFGISRGQGVGTTQGQGFGVAQGQGLGISQGQGSTTIRGQGVVGQGEIVRQGQGVGISQGQGFGVSRGEGQIISQGQGFGVSQGKGQGVITGEGQIIKQNQGFGVSQSGGATRAPGFGTTQGQGVGGQGQGITQGVGFGISQGKGQGVTTGQGQIVSQGQGFGVSQGQGFGVSQGQGFGVSQGQGFGISQGQGQAVSQGQGFGVRQDQGFGVLQGQGQGVSQGFGIRGEGQIGSQGIGFGVQSGQGLLTSQGFGAKLQQEKGTVVSQGKGTEVENEFGESIQRVFLKEYNSGSQCGQYNNLKPYGNHDDQEVDFAQIPWQAMVLLQTNRSLLCGGVITRPDVVITSAACVEGLEAKNVLIKGGEYKLGVDEEPLPFQIVQVKHILRHPSYKAGSFHYDAAILILEEDLNLAKNIYPICLPGFKATLESFYDGQGECIVTGWGKIVLQAHLEGAIMHSINVSLIRPNECQAKITQDYPHLLEQYDEDSCVCGEPSNPLDNICRVDIGSALACTTGDGHFVMRGVYSWDSGCQAGNQLAAFYKFDMEWYEWAIGLIESVRFAKYGVGTAISQNKVTTTKVTSGVKGVQFSGVKGSTGIGQFGADQVKLIPNIGQFNPGQVSGQFGQFGQFSSGKYTEKSSSEIEPIDLGGQINSPISNTFSATYSEKKVYQSEPKIVTYTTKPEFVTFTTKPEIVTFTTKPEIFTFTTKPKIVTYTTKPEIFTYTTKPKIVTYTTKPEIIRYTTKPKLISYAASATNEHPSYAAPAVSFNPSFTELVGQKHNHSVQCKCLEGKK